MESQNFKEPPNKKKKTNGRETETNKEKKTEVLVDQRDGCILTRFTKEV